MIIREFSERDIDEIKSLMKNLSKLRKQEFDEFRWKESFKNRNNNKTCSELIVALEETTQNVLGMAKFSIKNTENGFRFGQISNLIVKEEERRSGIGEEIIKHIIDYFKLNHIDSIRLALNPNTDDNAKKLFIKLGFKDMLHVYELKI